MFHDRELHGQKSPTIEAQLVNLAFQLNAHALKLSAIVSWYEKAGYTTLPVAHLRRVHFTRREWELATKGTRQYEGRKLVDPDQLGKDGCEALGIVTEQRLYDPATKRTKTVWTIGQVSSEQLEELRKERFEDCEVIEESEELAATGPDEKLERQERRNEKPDAELSCEKAYNEGFADGYAKGVRCVNDAPLDIDTKGASKTHVTVRRDQLENCLLFIENWHEVTSQAPVEENPNSANLAALLRNAKT